MAKTLINKYCEYCAGTGKMHAEVMQPDGTMQPIEYDCNTCTGKGYVAWGYFNTKSIQIEPIPTPIAEENPLDG